MNSEEIKKLKNKLRIKLVFLIAIFLSFNTLAWFIYSSRVENSITTDVRAWRINFNGDEDNAKIIVFDIEEIYPGMSSYENSVRIQSDGESVANVKYTAVFARILDEEYEEGDDYTSEEIIEALAEDYPFKIIFELTNDTLSSSADISDFYVYVSWPFESGDDALDTFYGNKSYQFKIDNPDLSGLSISIKIEVDQG